MSRAEDALMRLYESASLRDELTDDEAKQLLKWAEDEVVRLDESGADDDAFDGRVETLMRLLKQMNRYAGRQGQFSAQGVDETPQQIAGLAQELGHGTDAAQISAASTGDPLGTVQALTALFSAPETAATTANAPQAAEPIPHDAPSEPQPAPPADQPDPPVDAAPMIDYLPLDTFGDDVDDPTDET